jgi:nitrogen fixation/metabolism regulation signal transduction histidine kinase
MKELLPDLSLNRKLILMMLFLSFILTSFLLFFYTHTEKALLGELERQTVELTKAIQIGVEEVTATGSTDEARLSKYLKGLNTKGVREISIISNADEIVASSSPEKIGQPITHKRKELIIKAELGDPVSEEGSTYNVIVPVIADNVQYGYVHLKVNKDDFSAILRANAMRRIAATIAVFGIGIIMTLFLAQRYTRPIQKVVDAAKRVAAGDLHQTITAQGRDEIGQLSESFNFMVKKLRENRSLEEKLREAEHLSGIGQLSRDMAHEIRNPLNFISLSIDHIGTKYRPSEDIDREKFLELIGGIRQEIQRLNKLVTEFLDYSRPMRLQVKRVRINDLLSDVLGLIWAKAEADGIGIVRDYSSDQALNVDPDLLKSCILNIVTNAFHAMADMPAAKEKRLTIRTETEGKEFILSIIDTGRGVEPEDISRLFDPFFSKRQNGLGLGLPMTKRVAEENGGRIEFISSVGEGSEVRLILPITGG